MGSIAFWTGIVDEEKATTRPVPLDVVPRAFFSSGWGVRPRLFVGERGVQPDLRTTAAGFWPHRTTHSAAACLMR